MSIRNNHWYNLNEQRNYPITDTASCLSDRGVRLPNDIIQDLRIRWPSSLGQFAYIGALSVTEHIVTVLIEAAKTVDNNPDEATLIAAVSVPKSELVAGQTLNLQPFADYVGGFITLGNFGDQLYSGIFNSPLQTGLAPRAARYTRVPPVPSISVDNSAVSLSGVVNLTAVPPLSITKETKVIAGVEYDNVIVFNLFQETANLQDTATADSVFSTFAGDCGNRIGARTCPDPQPIESINGISPDCDGVLTLEFSGCAIVGRNTEDCGVVVDCSLGLSSSCDPPYLPTFEDGILPVELGSLLNTEVPTPPEVVIPVENSISESVTTILSLPYCDTFDDGIAYGFSVLGDASYGIISDDSPNESNCCLGAGGNYGCSQSESNGWVYDGSAVASSYGPIVSSAETKKNISLFTSDVQTLFRKYSTDLKIVSNIGGSLQNAGILVNYRILDSGLVTYFLALVDVTNSKFGIYYYNGVSLVPISETEIISLAIDEWYTVTLKSYVDESAVQVNFVATIQGVTTPSINATITTSTPSSTWVSDSGNAGLYTNRSKGYFSYWRIDEATA